MSPSSENRSDAVKNFFSQPEVYLKKNFTILTRSRILREELKLQPHYRVLDLGCGDGSLSIPLLPFVNDLTLVDFSKAMLDLARNLCPPDSRSKVSFVEKRIGDFCQSSRDAFDVILGVGILAHMQPDEVSSLFDFAASALKPNGTFIVELANRDALEWMLIHSWRGSASPYRLQPLNLSGTTKRLEGHSLRVIKTICVPLTVLRLQKLSMSFASQIQFTARRIPLAAKMFSEVLIFAVSRR